MLNSFNTIDLVIQAYHRPFVRSLLTNLADYHMPTYIHSLHVALIAVQMGSEHGFSDTDLLDLASGALLHDIGKIEIPLSILDKDGPLTDEEFAVIKMHPLISYQLLNEQSVAHAHVIDLICLMHHLYLDDTGYPSGSEMPFGIDTSIIPAAARIVTISDIFGAIVSPRPYKYSLTNTYAMGELYKLGDKVDAHFVKILDHLVAENRLLLNTSGDCLMQHIQESENN